MTLSSHINQHIGTDEWLTPPEILSTLGTFDLDPCAPINRPWDTAKHHYTTKDDGLSKPWFGRVWLNPPFGREVGRWLERMVEHQDGVALVAARTETRWFFRYIWEAADGILFIKGRPHFYYANGNRAPFNSGAPIVLIAYGVKNVECLAKSELGRFINLT